MKIKNKLLILLVISFVFIFFFNVKEILAVNVTVNSNCPNSNLTEMSFPEVTIENLSYYYDEEEGYYDLNTGYIVQYDNASSCYYLYIFRFYDGNYFYVGLDDNGNNAIRCHGYMTVYKTEGSIWKLTNKLSGDAYGIAHVSPKGCISLDNPIYLNCNVYSDIDKTGFFFPEPIPEIPEIPATTIPALETVEQIPTAMVEILKLIVPVGLVIFGIVLLISLIKSVISRMT